MQRMLVMTIIGPDRPGLVESVAQLVTGHGGNWLESRMSHLGGQFAGILRVEVPAEQERSLVDTLLKLKDQGLTVVAHTDQPLPATGTGRANLLEIVGQDRPGIVSQISRALAKHGVNVEDLQTEWGSAAMSGETLFKARARLTLPQGCDTAELRRELEKIAADLIVEISFGDLEAAASGKTAA